MPFGIRFLVFAGLGVSVGYLNRHIADSGSTADSWGYVLSASIGLVVYSVPFLVLDSLIGRRNELMSDLITCLVAGILGYFIFQIIAPSFEQAFDNLGNFSRGALKNGIDSRSTGAFLISTLPGSVLLMWGTSSALVGIAYLVNRITHGKRAVDN